MRIMEIRVIRGGWRYIQGCSQRLVRYQNIYRKSKKAVLKRRIIVLKRRIQICKRLFYSKKVQYLRRRVTTKKLVQKRTIKVVRWRLKKRILRQHKRLIKIYKAKIAKGCKKMTSAHRRKLRLRILRSRVIIGGRAFVQSINHKIKKYVKIYKKKQYDAIKKRIIFLRREFRNAKRIWSKVRIERRKWTFKETIYVPFGRRMYRRIIVIKRRLDRTKRVFKKVKNPTKGVKKVYSKKKHALQSVFNRLFKIGRDHKTDHMILKDVEGASGLIANNLEKVLTIAKKAATLPPASAAKAQKKIVDLLKENIKDTRGVKEKIEFHEENEEEGHEKKDSHHGEKKHLVQVTQTPAANATA